MSSSSPRVRLTIWRDTPARLGLAVSRKVDPRAVGRNRIKRVLRDATRVLFTCEQERLLARESFWLYRVKEAVVNYGAGTPPE